MKSWFEELKQRVIWPGKTANVKGVILCEWLPTRK